MTARKKKNEIKDEDVGFEFEEGSETDIGEVLDIDIESEDEDIEEDENDTNPNDEESVHEITDESDMAETEETESENEEEVTVTVSVDESDNDTDTKDIETETKNDTESKESDEDPDTDTDTDTDTNTNNISNDSNLNDTKDINADDKADAVTDEGAQDDESDADMEDTDADADADAESDDDKDKGDAGTVADEKTKAEDTDTKNDAEKSKTKIDIKALKDKTIAIITVFGKKTVSITKKVASKTKAKIKTKVADKKQKRKENKLDDDGNPKPKEKFGVKWHRYWFGDDTHKVKPSSFKGVLGRFYLKTFCGYVDLYSRMYDKDIDEIRQDIELVKRSKLPKEAVRLKGFKRTWDIDIDLPIRYFDLTKDDGFTASSYFNYAKNNILSDSMYMDGEEQAKTPTNKRMLIAVVGVLCFGMIIVYMYAMGMI